MTEIEFIHLQQRQFPTPFCLFFSARSPRKTHARVSRAMAQFFLKIAHLSFSMGPTPMLKMAVSYGLHPRLWFLPRLIVRILLVSARTHSISRCIHIQTLCVHKRNVLRFLQHGTYHVVVRGGSGFCQSPKGGGQEFFLLKRKGGATLFWEKIPKFPSPPSPKKNVPSLSVASNISAM